MAERGDWRARAEGLSAAGRMAAKESFAHIAFSFVARRLPGWRERHPTAGYRGRYDRGPLVNGLRDRAWPVRVAAALALGECRSPSSVPALERMLGAPFRAERIAAAAAIVRCGGTVSGVRSALLDGALPAPARIGDTTSSVEFLTTLTAAHPDVIAAWSRIEDVVRPAGAGAEDWARFLAGDPLPESDASVHAEIERYDAAGETEYLLAKPFSPINRVQNIRLLHTFLTVIEHLRIPPNARVVDLGGGSAWVSELLVRFGFQPITLDVSSALLTVGRRRFSAAGLTPRFVAADMARLPIASGSIDAAIVVDALHHVPDVPAVFEEVFRVLGTGGLFLLAEPGEGHAETGKSRGEVLEHGVQEREIHLREVFEDGRAAGFDDIRAIPHYVPGIAMTLDQLTAATGSPADQWRVLNHDEPISFAPYVLQSMFDHPIVVLRKGRRLADSLAPRLLRAEIAPRLTRDGARVTGAVTVRNTGDTIWLGGADSAGHVRLGIQLLSGDRRLLAMEFGRVQLPRSISPGESAELRVDVRLPDATTPFVLKLDMVDEQICWFDTPVFFPR